MKITLEMIDELRERKNVSYSKAKEALEKTDGNMVDAIVYLEQNTTVPAKKTDSFIDKIKDFIKHLNNITVDITKGDKLALRLPFLIFAFITIIGLPFVLMAAVVYMLLGYKFKIKDGDQTMNSVNQAVNKMADKMKSNKEEK